MRPLKIISVILGIVFVLAGLAGVGAGGFGLGAYKDHVGAAGYFTTPSQMVGSYGFALTAPNINAQLGSQWEKWVPTRAQATVRVTGTSQLEAPIFIGVAPTAKVSKYLAGAARDRIKSIDLSAGSVQYEHVDGMSFPSAPGAQSFWVAKVEGTGAQTLEWDLEPGDWCVVVMNGDASPPVAASMTLAAHFGIISTLLIGVTAAGVVLALFGGLLIGLGARRRRAAPAPQPRLIYGHDPQSVGIYEELPVYEDASDRGRPPAPQQAPRAAVRRTPPPPPPGSWDL